MVDWNRDLASDNTNNLLNSPKSPKIDMSIGASKRYTSIGSRRDTSLELDDIGRNENIQNEE